MLVIFLVTSLAGVAQSTYIKHYKPLCKSLSLEYGIPSSVILGVAIVESSKGKSRYCMLLNNHFGIVGKNNLLQTMKIKTRYKRYPNSRASFIDFCRVISRKKFYKKLKGNRSYAIWLTAISKAGYSEKPFAWKQKVTSAIKNNKLM